MLRGEALVQERTFHSLRTSPGLTLLLRGSIGHRTPAYCAPWVKNTLRWAGVGRVPPPKGGGGLPNTIVWTPRPYPLDLGEMPEAVCPLFLPKLLLGVVSCLCRPTPLPSLSQAATPPGSQ